ncbi:MAG TPA: ATP-binding protein [Rectinemataceae bacterium]|nr:ATP-binding protein [Rectinemataceae bacterium]
MDTERLLPLIYEEQNRILRCGGIERYCHHRILAAFSSSPIKIVTGFRRSGKSWLCRQVVRDLVNQGKVVLENVLYLNFEDYRLDEIRSPAELDAICGFFSARVAKQGAKVLLLDEVQNVSGWERFLRGFHEREHGWQILVTGSNSELLSSEFAAKLAGRHIDFELLPFSFREVLAYRGVSIRTEADYFRHHADIGKAFEEFIAAGGLPERLTIQDPSAIQSYLGGILSKVILDDVIKRYRVEHVAVLERLLSFILSSPGQVISFAALSKRLSALGNAIKTDTVIRYVGYLHSVYAVFELGRFDWKLSRLFDTTRKYYGIDTGIMNLYRRTAENRSFMLENIVYLELRRRGTIPHYGSLQKGGELDFLVPGEERRWQAVQVCTRLSDENQKRELGIFAVAEESLKQKESLLLVEEGQKEEIAVDGIMVHMLPLVRWLLVV